MSAPTASPGIVVIEVTAAGVNLPDVIMVRGDYQLKPDPPFTPGREVVGRVVATSPEDEELLGRRVAARPMLPDGGYTEVTRARRQDIFELPEHVDDYDAATLLVTYLTAHVALHHRAGARPGETVLVLGAAGGVGSAATELAVAAGARVIAVSSGGKRSGACVRLGAHRVMDRHTDDLTSILRDETSGRGVDVIIDPVGGPLFDIARKSLAWEGRAVLVGFASGDLPRLPANAVLLRNQTVMGLHLGPYQEHRPQVPLEAFADLLSLYAEGAIRPLIAEVHPLSDALEAMDAIESGSVTGKLVLDPRQ